MSVRSFVEDPMANLASVEAFRKEEWREVARHYELEVASSARKAEIRGVVMAYLRESGMLHGAVGGEADAGGRGDTVEQGRDQREDLELRKLEIELQYRREQAALDRAHELEITRLRAEVNGRERGDAFLYKGKALVPRFEENSPDDFFTGFESVARRMGWEEEKWMILAQSAFSGKAQAAYMSLGVEERQDYWGVKEEILRAFQITPEYHRSRFRDKRKAPGQRFAEFAQEQRRSLMKWWRGLGVETLEQAEEVVLLEQFMQGIAPEIKLYLRERRVETVEEAARLAEDYALVVRSGRENGGRACFSMPDR